MNYDDKVLFTNVDKEPFKEWTSKWVELRNRHPFFLYCDDITMGVVDVIESYEEVVSKIDMEIDVVIHSSGGPLYSSFKAPYCFKEICPNYVAVVPRRAKSGATLFTLGASKILMGKWSELGPMDPQISRSGTDRHYFSSPESALESFHALRFAQKEVTEYLDIFVEHLINKGISPRHAVKEAKDLVEATIGRIYSNVSPFELGNSGRALEVMEKYSYKILNDVYQKDDLKKAISNRLVWEYPDHGFFIDADEAKVIGLKIEKASSEIQDLLDTLHDQILTEGDTACIGTLIPAGAESTKKGAKNGNRKPRRNTKTRGEVSGNGTTEEGRTTGEIKQTEGSA